MTRNSRKITNEGATWRKIKTLSCKRSPFKKTPTSPRSASPTPASARWPHQLHLGYVPTAPSCLPPAHPLGLNITSRDPRKQKLNLPARARRIARSSRQIPTPSRSKKIPGPQSSSPVLLPPFTPGRGQHGNGKRQPINPGGRHNLVARAARLSRPAEPTSKTSAGLPVDLL
jgi:hypothetical protein